MSVKSELRKQFKSERKAISNKEEADIIICKNLLSSTFYKNAKTVLFYAALDDEINLDCCILDALNSNKKVALPVCLDNDGNMEFYYINSLDDILVASFGVREPNSNCKKVTDFSGSVCIVPGIAFDRHGYRLGYGKGYYDRFLKNYTLNSVGVCYNKLIKEKLPVGEYDIAVDYIVSENGIFSANGR
ncbi:MAG: 5-formyltetrahydrofolate cyclo-ligase [Clostridiales bacterium]|nr:5-formyltetrahydrofolate cyclo-ligase [Clostridiales bacterium]